MTSNEIRQTFLDFFKSKQHKIVSSAPLVNKEDPTLMFVNAGMNQFKDYFLGHQVPDNRRIADTQKCLRVSGKHNDLEEVGLDSYHHTLFEMLGNWSFGDYFKKEAIAWGWELLTEVYGLSKDRLYVSVFEGDEKEGLKPDSEAAELWKEWVSEDKILFFDKKDNFWEMGASGPCGPCSEIHVDLRSDEERAKIPGKDLVNADDPLVVEIWNLVFIQFNRKADGSLEELPEKHVDTGMGFERLCMAVQGKTSNYDTGVFAPFIAYIEKVSGKKYSGSYAPDAKTDIAMRVVVDHIRAVALAIADGQLPENTGAGYVIRRILRRAVRYYYSFLDIKEPFLHTIVSQLADSFAGIFPELKAQEKQVARVIEGEETAFLHTLEKGLRRFDTLDVSKGIIAGQDAFELFDTYGFPIDLTRLIAGEKGFEIDEAGFKAALTAQKARSRVDAEKEVGDWIELDKKEKVEFVGYDKMEVESTSVIKYRIVKVKKNDEYQIVLSHTPFYAESGGQAGDKGILLFGEKGAEVEKIVVLDTLKDNDLTVHIVKNLPKNIAAPVHAIVDKAKRLATESNHSATHLMHAAMHQVIGEHALQKGQDVDHKRIRFDFAHFQKASDEELQQIEDIVNQKIRENISLTENRSVPIEEAKSAGAMMLFGEKYGDHVRTISFDKNFSNELCGGTHVSATGKIGLFKIVSESAIAAGIRRIEAFSGAKAQAYVKTELNELQQVRQLFKNPKDTPKQIASLQAENKSLKKEIEKLLAEQAGNLKGALLSKMENINGVNFIAAVVPLNDSNAIKTLAYQLEKEAGDAFIVFGAEINGKPQLQITISKNLTENKGLHAGNIIRDLAREIQGGGGGQPFFATAGGKNVAGLATAIEKAKGILGA